MTTDHPEVPEFSRPVDVSRIGDDELEYEIEANEAEREALSRRFGLIAVPSLSAVVRLRRSRGGIRVTLDFKADVVQTCVVSLEPVPAHVEESATAVFEHGTPTSAADIDLSDVEGDIPEPFTGDSIDIGELTAQYLALALDPYPKAPGIRFESYTSGAAAQPQGPFSALKDLREQDKKR